MILRSTRSHRRAPGTPPGHPLLHATFLALLAAATFGVAGGRARAAERTASWSIGPLEVVSKGTTRRMPEGTLVDGYTLEAPARVRGDAPVADGVLVVHLSSFSPARDLPRQPRGLFYVRGTWRLVPSAPSDADVRRGAEGLHGVVTAALPADPTAGGGGFTLRTRLAPGGNRGVRAGDGALTVSDRRTAELVLTYR